MDEIKQYSGGNILDSPIFKFNNESVILKALVNHGVEVEFLDPVTFKSILIIRRKENNGKEE